MPGSPSSAPTDDLYGALDVAPTMRRQARIAVSTLNQWAMDFDGNRDRIIESIQQAKDEGARYRLGPELEVTGYSCDDYFYEPDTLTHSGEVLAEILYSGVTEDILCSIGMPIMHQGVRYNCDVFVLNGKIVGIRPKKILADDGNYREPRWFTAWSKDRQVESFTLPPLLRTVTQQDDVPIGDFIIETDDTVISAEKCEEMFAPRNPGIDLGLDGTEMLGNSSGSHWQIRKLQDRVRLVTKASGVYAYSNLSGCDGGRLLFDGSSMVSANGKLVAQGEQFSLKEVQTLTAVVDFEAVQSKRASIRSLGIQADATQSFPRINIKRDLNIEFGMANDDLSQSPSKPIEPTLLSPEEEIAKGPALWLWDYLRRSGASGFFLPLSGGVDSSSTGSIVGSMCHMVFKEIEEGNDKVLKDLQKIVDDLEFIPTSPQDIAGRIFVTTYMGNEGTSSDETKERAENLSSEIGADHYDADISPEVEAYRQTILEVLGIDPKFESQGGTKAEDLALQNIQARIRMLLSYYIAQLYQTSKGRKGFLLVLSSANVDEALMGYMTKYDCSSGDLNPIGGLNKMDLRSFLAYAAETFGYHTLLKVLAAAPTAELQPLEGQAPQTDEEDMGITYVEASILGKLRKEKRMGPASMFEHLVNEWGPGSAMNMPISEIAEKVKKFFRRQIINRHKLPVLTPAVHAESYSPDANRFDLRPILIRPDMPRQFRHVDRMVKIYEESGLGQIRKRIPSH